MHKFILAYHGVPELDSPEASKKHMKDWMAWSTALGNAIVDPGTPVGMSKTISANGVENNGGSNPLSGITTLQARTMEEAIEMTKNCPHILAGGTIEIAQTMEMDN